MQITHGQRAPSARRNLIVETSLAILAAEGVEGLTFARVREVAGLSSSRLITYHFTDRHGLMNAVSERVLTDMGSAVGEAMSDSRPGLDQLAALLVANAEFMRDNRGHVVALAALAVRGLAPAAAATSTDTQTVIADLVRAAQGVGGVREDVDPEDVAFLIMRTLEGLAMAVAADPDLDPTVRARGMAVIICAGVSR